MYIYIICTYIAADDLSSLVVHVVHSLRGSGDPALKNETLSSGGEDLQIMDSHI